MSKVVEGSNVTVHYVGTLEDGTKFDSSHDRDSALTFEVGRGQMIPGFDFGVIGMVVGEKRNLNLAPEKAYGEPVPDAIQEVGLNQFPEGAELTEGVTVFGRNDAGQQVMARVVSLGEEKATLDFNHPLAGKTLNFEVELLSIND